MLHIYTGDGKGKTTCAIGLAIRFAGTGGNVLFSQYMKGSKSAELNTLNLIPNIEVVRNTQDFGFYQNMTHQQRLKMLSMHNETLNYCCSMAETSKYGLIVLDEITYAYNFDLIDRYTVENFIDEYSKKLEIVITGQSPDDYFLNRADYITEMKKIKHPYDMGIVARLGIEY